MIIEMFKNFVKRCFHFMQWDKWLVCSWSQEGEDLILRRVFDLSSTGFYIDVGAHHPKRFSNTYLFYKKGWCGINIDAMPGSMKIFNKYRKRDINIEIGIGTKEEKLDYYMFNEPALNGFSHDLSKERIDASNRYRLIKSVSVEIKPLAMVLDRYITLGQTIDFLTIDVEGLDYQVLVSNNWSKYRPKYVLVEILENDLHNINDDNIVQFMIKNCYVLFAKCVHTVIFKDSK